MYEYPYVSAGYRLFVDQCFKLVGIKRTHKLKLDIIYVKGKIKCIYIYNNSSIFCLPQKNTMIIIV
jgi:hypothetical protein